MQGASSNPDKKYKIDEEFFDTWVELKYGKAVKSWPLDRVSNSDFSDVGQSFLAFVSPKPIHITVSANGVTCKRPSKRSNSGYLRSTALRRKPNNLTSFQPRLSLRYVCHSPSF